MYIKREDAIETVHKYFVEALNNEPCETDEDGDEVFADMKSVNKLLTHNKTISKALKKLPSAEAEWIPVSERLPEKKRSVLITTSEDFVGEACYWATTENHVIWKGYRWEATYWDDEVIAWMPLPKPYREDGK